MWHLHLAKKTNEKSMSKKLSPKIISRKWTVRFIRTHETEIYNIKQRQLHFPAGRMHWLSGDFFVAISALPQKLFCLEQNNKQMECLWMKQVYKQETLYTVKYKHFKNFLQVQITKKR